MGNISGTAGTMGSSRDSGIGGSNVSGWAPGEREEASRGRGFTAQQEAAARHGLSIGAYDVRSALNQRGGALKQANARNAYNRALRNYQKAYASAEGALADVRHKDTFDDPQKRSQWATAVRKGELGKMRDLDPSYTPKSTGNYFGGFLGSFLGDMGLFNNTDDIHSIWEAREDLEEDGYIERTNPHSTTPESLLPTKYNKYATRQMAAEMNPNLAWEMDRKYLESRRAQMSPQDYQKGVSALYSGDWDTFDDVTTDWFGGENQFTAREAYSRAHPDKSGLLSNAYDAVKGWVRDEDEEEETERPYAKDLAQIDEAMAMVGQPMTPERMMGEYQVSGTGFSSPVGMALGLFSRPIATNAGMFVYDQTNNPGFAMSTAQATNALAKRASEAVQPEGYGDWGVGADFGTSRFGQAASRGVDYALNAAPGMALSALVGAPATQIGQSFGMMNTAANLDMLGLGVPHEKVYAERADTDSEDEGHKSVQTDGGGLLSVPLLTYDQLLASSYATPWWATVS